MSWPSARAKTATAGGSWVPADMNAVQDQYLRATGILDTDLDDITVGAKLGLSNGATVRRQKATVATDESTASTVDADLATVGPSVSVAVTAGGVLKLVAQAEAKNSSGSSSSIHTVITAGSALLTGATSITSATSSATFTWVGQVILIPVVASGIVTIGLQYHVAAGTGNFRNRTIAAAAENF